MGICTASALYSCNVYMYCTAFGLQAGRIRHIIMDLLYEKRANERAVWLFTNILSRRVRIPLAVRQAARDKPLPAMSCFVRRTLLLTSVHENQLRSYPMVYSNSLTHGLCSGASGSSCAGAWTCRAPTADGLAWWSAKRRPGGWITGKWWATAHAASPNDFAAAAATWANTSVASNSNGRSARGTLQLNTVTVHLNSGVSTALLSYIPRLAIQIFYSNILFIRIPILILLFYSYVYSWALLYQSNKIHTNNTQNSKVHVHKLIKKLPLS